MPSPTRPPARRSLCGVAAVLASGVLLALVVALGLAATPAQAQRAAEGVYSPGGWATLHRSAANRKLVRDVALAGEYAIWTVLEGASVLTAPTVSPDGETLYVTTGRARGASNLHAFALDGTLRWRAAPWTAADAGVDPCAILSSPIVDLAGDVYIGDCNQLFAFRPDGRIKWVVPLPPLREGDWRFSEELAVNALTTAAFTREGHVFGVTNFGDVVVFDRRTGRRLNAPMRLPGHVPGRSAVMPMPKSVFTPGLVDPAIREWSWQLLAGGNMPSANTPAVDLASGRIFVAATAEAEGRGALYALELSSDASSVSEAAEAAEAASKDGAGAEAAVAASVSVTIAFATEMGPGSGSSPALSPDAATVYVSDERGLFYAVDAGSGAIRWQVETKAASAAAAVGADGTIYALQAEGPAVIAIRPDGRVRWESGLAALAEARLPRSGLLGGPVALGNGNPTVVGDVVLVPVVYGYETRLGRRVPWPVESAVVALDARTGRGLRDVVTLADDSTGITGVLPDGTITSSLGTALTSGVSPLAGLARWLLPGDREPLTARGGLQVSRPVEDTRARARRGMRARLAARSEADRARDRFRRPLEVLGFAGVEEGMRVAELMAGRGWYAEVLARAVGPGGHVIAQNNGFADERFGEVLRERVGAEPVPGRAPIELVVAELEALPLEPAEAPFARGSLDAVFLALFYHDTWWMGVDRAELNRRVFEALRPGGVYLVIDHHAAEGAGSSVVRTLHRVEAPLVRQEIEAAGFRLAARSDLLAHPEDDRTTNVFDPAIRGRTDRFLWRFEKPAADVAGSPGAPADVATSRP